jgi:hypothetical protein
MESTEKSTLDGTKLTIKTAVMDGIRLCNIYIFIIHGGADLKDKLMGVKIYF